jgi:predicted glycosyltransferase
VRAILYSHDGLGLGHVRRNLAIADAVTRLDPAASVLLVCSTDQVDSLVIPSRVDVLKLPGVRKTADATYAAHRLPMTEAETWSMRSGLIASATRSFAPDVLLSDKHPHGAHGELREALGALHAAGGRAVLGLRDILDDPATVRAEWQRGRVLAAIASDYDRVLVYGSPDVLHPGRAYGMPEPVLDMLRFCGYVASTPPADERTELRSDDDGRPTVVATAGGGADGYAMLSDFVRASRSAPWHPVVISGADASPVQQEGLRRDTEAIDGTYHRFVRNLPLHFADIAALVSMGGYNTTVEALSSAVPTVVVPRVEPRQEQLIRARAFGALGLVRVVEPDRLGGPALHDQICAALTDSRSRIRHAVARHLDLDGARRAASHLLALADRPDAASTPLAEPISLSSRLPSAMEPVDVAV